MFKNALFNLVILFAFTNIVIADYYSRDFGYKEFSSREKNSENDNQSCFKFQFYVRPNFTYNPSHVYQTNNHNNRYQEESSNINDNIFNRVPFKGREKFRSFEQKDWDKYLRSLDEMERPPRDWSEKSVKSLFNQYNLYEFAGFRAYLESIPSYNKHMLELGKKLHEDKKFKQKIRDIKEWESKDSENTSNLYEYIKNKEVKILYAHALSNGVLLAVKSKNYYEYLESGLQNNIEESGEVDPETNKKNQERLDAIKKTKNSLRKYAREYEVPNIVQEYAKNKGYDFDTFKNFKGNYSQHKLHKEHIHLISKVDQLLSGTQYKTKELDDFIDNAIESINIAHKLNAVGRLESAYAFTDFCSDLLTFGDGVISAFIDNGKALSDVFLHPFDTSEKLNQLANKASASFARAITTAMQDPAGIFYDLYNKSGDVLSKIYDGVSNHLSKSSRQEILKSVGYCVTDLFIGCYSSQAFKAISSLTKSSKTANMISNGSKRLEKFGVIGKKSAELIGRVAEREKETKALINKLKGRINQKILNPKLKDIKLIGYKTGRLSKYIEFQTEIFGGEKGAKEIFKILTGKSPNDKFFRSIKDKIEVVYREVGKSGHAKIEIIDHAREFYQKITFK